MSRLVDMTGKKFGRLTVIRRSYPNTKYNKAMWLCKCDCGREKIVHGGSLRNGETKSCGCLQKEIAGRYNCKRLRPGLPSIRMIMRTYKANIKRQKLEFTITEEQFVELMEQNCYYCGAEPSNITKDRNKYGNRYVYNGIDRVDSKKGYTIDNVVPCCAKCNYAKREMSLQEFRNWVERVYNKFIGGRDGVQN